MIVEEKGWRIGVRKEWRILNCTIIMNSVVRMIQLIPPTDGCRVPWTAGIVVMFSDSHAPVSATLSRLKAKQL